jgi:hypothetical protein
MTLCLVRHDLGLDCFMTKNTNRKKKMASIKLDCFHGCRMMNNVKLIESENGVSLGFRCTSGLFFEFHNTNTHVWILGIWLLA